MSHDVPIEVTEAAAEWVDRLSRQPSAARVREFARWLLRSPVHVEEFLRVTALREELEQAALPEWVADILARRDPGIAEIPIHSPLGTARPHRRAHRPRFLPVAGGVAAAALLAWVVWFVSPASPPDGHAASSVTTEVGEQRFLPLADGSTIQLNTDSSVDIRLGTTERQVDLRHGEALFDVVVDPERPFRVVSHDVIVEAIGTRFSVFRRAEDTRVTVVEGRVSVIPNRAAPSAAPTSPNTTETPIELIAGQQAFWSPEQVPLPAPVDPAKVTAWTERRLVFEDEPLDGVVAEFNRYNVSRLSVGDPALSKRRITGVFDVNDPDRFIEVLNELEPIRVLESGDGHRTLHPATEG
ncbi:MAG: FecR domain-containing protein [Gammaproteobacteria bacterium]|nr:FecR domain-containing protein [Gammaproteobacteria bacterium]